MNEDTSGFVKILSTSKQLTDKWAQGLAIQADILDRFGVSVDEAAIRSLQQARLVTLSNSELSEEEYWPKLNCYPN